MQIKDMPKLESPFVREMIGDMYVVTPRIAKGYEWVFEDSSVICTEKLDGTNVSLVMEGGAITSVWNRENRVPLLTGDWRIMEAIIEAGKKGYLPKEDGQHFGEVIGPNVNGNPYKQERHVWMPLATYVREHLAYTSWGKYPKTYEAISEWLRNNIFSLFMRKRGLGKAFPEGVVFFQPDTGKMAKLRRDMFPWAKEAGLDIHKGMADLQEGKESYEKP